MVVCLSSDSTELGAEAAASLSVLELSSLGGASGSLAALGAGAAGAGAVGIAETLSGDELGAIAEANVLSAVGGLVDFTTSSTASVGGGVLLLFSGASIGTSVRAGISGGISSRTAASSSGAEATASLSRVELNCLSGAGSSVAALGAGAAAASAIGVAQARSGDELGAIAETSSVVASSLGLRHGQDGRSSDFSELVHLCLFMSLLMVCCVCGCERLTSKSDESEANHVCGIGY